MFPITVTIHNMPDLQKVFAAMGANLTVGTSVLGQPLPNTAGVAAAPVEKSSAKPSPKATGAKAEAQSAPSSPTAEAAGAGAATQSTEQAAPTTSTAQAATANSASDAPAPTYKDAADAITALVKAKGRPAGEAVLKEFGATNLPGVKPEQFADVIAAAKAAMGG